MGLFIGIIRKIELKMMKSTYQWQVHLITRAKMTATKAASNLLQVGTDYESDSLIAKKLQERQYKLKILEEKLDLQKSELEAKIQMINTELQSNQDMIQSGIQESFSYKIG
ncbi:hypothetical protein HDR58_07495 [bacterium]|nr:hypothetical protein [bacterium]